MTALDSIHDRVLEGLAAFTRTVALPGIADVYTRMQYSEECLSYPCVVWTPEGQTEEDADSQTWETVDVWFPAQCYIADRVDRGNEAMRATLLGWRHKLFVNLRTLAALPNVPECYDVRIKYGIVIDPKLPQYATVVGAFSCTALCRYIKPADANVINTGNTSPQ